MDNVVEKYGVKFIRLNEQHLEMVRNWRNSDYVRTKMVFQDIITPEMQQNWFQKINNDQNYYFITEYNGVPVGLANIKDIANGEGECGFFLADEKYEDTDIAARASFATGYVFFELLGLDKIRIQVLRSNKKAMSYNLFMGYKEVPERSTPEIAHMEIRKEQGNKKLHLLEKYLQTKTI